MTILDEAHAPSVHVETARGWRSTFISLENRNFRWFWISTLSWFTGTQMQVFARGWLAYNLTNSALALGLVSAAFGLAILIFSSFAGAVTDRVEKRNLLMTTQVVAAAVNLALAISISLGTVALWQLIAAGAVSGTAIAFNSPGRQSSIAELVTKDQLMNAVALSTGALNITRVGAPALAGLLVGMIGVQFVYYISVFCYFIAAVALFMVPPLGVSEHNAESSVVKDVAKGFSYVRKSQVLFALITLAFVPILFGMPYQSLMPVVAAEVLNKDATGLGFLMASMGAGALIGSLGVASMGNFKHKGWLLLGSCVAFGITLILFASSNVYWLSLLLVFAVGIANTVYSTSNMTLLQLNVEDDMRGRVMGIYMNTIGLLPFSLLPISYFAERFGVQTALAAGGAIVVVFTLAIAFLRPGLRKL